MKKKRTTSEQFDWTKIKALPFKKWPTKALQVEAKSLHHLINVVDCFGSRDVLNLEGILVELERRGIEGHTTLNFE